GVQTCGLPILIEILKFAIIFVVFYMIFIEKEKSWPARIFGFLILLGMFFVGEKLHGYWFFIGLIAFPLALIGISRLLFPGENEDQKSYISMFLILVCFISLGKIL